MSSAAEQEAVAGKQAARGRAPRRRGERRAACRVATRRAGLAGHTGAAGRPVPDRAGPGGGDELRAVGGRGGGGGTVPVRRAGPRWQGEPGAADRADARDLARLRAGRRAPGSVTASGCTAAGTRGPAPAGIRRSCCSTRTRARWTVTSCCPPRCTGTSATGPSSMWRTPCATTATRRRTSRRASSSTTAAPTTSGRTTGGRRRRGRTRSSTSCTCAASPSCTPASPRSCAARTRGWRIPRRSST